jgi:hypothetical protein
MIVRGKLSPDVLPAASSAKLEMRVADTELGDYDSNPAA